MKTLQLRAFGKPGTALELVETAPPAPAAGQVLVALEAAPINPSDLLLITGRYGVRPTLPAALGAEGVGRIVAVGPGADPVRIGKRVLIVPTLEHGTWQDQVVIDEVHAVAVDAKAEAPQLAMLGINPLTADLLLRTFTDLAPRAWVGQTGANSAVGRYVVALARQAGLRTLNVVRRPEVATDLVALGADAVVVSGADLAGQLAAALGPDRVALVLDAVGGDATTELAHSLVFGGTIVSYGGMSGTPLVVSPADLIFRDVRLRGFWLKHWLDATPRAQIAQHYGRLAALVADGVLRAPVEATYPLDQYREALTHAARAGRAGKVLFTW
jgi:NADPH:quinone reductase-like Zn-dependent oxidoreductase